MAYFANQSEKVKISQCKNGMLLKKLWLLFFTVFVKELPFLSQSSTTLHYITLNFTTLLWWRGSAWMWKEIWKYIHGSSVKWKSHLEKAVVCRSIYKLQPSLSGCVINSGFIQFTFFYGFLWSSITIKAIGRCHGKILDQLHSCMVGVTERF